MIDKIISYIFTPSQSGKYKYVDPNISDLFINPIPDGYTNTEPEQCCNTCVLYDRCPNELCKAYRLPMVAHWPGKMIMPAYPINYPPCIYHTTKRDVVEWREDNQCLLEDIS